MSDKHSTAQALITDTGLYPQLAEMHNNAVVVWKAGVVQGKPGPCNNNKTVSPCPHACITSWNSSSPSVYLYNSDSNSSSIDHVCVHDKVQQQQLLLTLSCKHAEMLLPEGVSYSWDRCTTRLWYSLSPCLCVCMTRYTSSNCGTPAHANMQTC